MMLIVRLYPEKSLAPLWKALEKHIDALETKKYTALYASQLSGKNFISVIFELQNLEDIEEFYTKALTRVPNVRKTETLALMKTKYFSVPKDAPSGLQRFLVHVTVHPKYYTQIYDKISDFKYPKNTIITYLSYSLGDDDLLVSILVENAEQVMDLVEKRFIKFPGVEGVKFTHVIRTMRLISKAKWKMHQEKYLEAGGKGQEKEGNTEYDWGFDDLADLTGGFAKERR